MSEITSWIRSDQECQCDSGSSIEVKSPSNPKSTPDPRVETKISDLSTQILEVPKRSHETAYRQSGEKHVQLIEPKKMTPPRYLQANAHSAPLVLSEKLGEGGMGVVYRAESEDYSGPVAVKYLREDLAADDVILRRFQKEASTLRQLRHPNIAMVFDFVIENGPYMVMEYVDGESLSNVFAYEKAVPPQRVIDWVIQVTSALQVAHGKGIVHRDLKPSNILLCETARGETVKLVDFGIAKVTTGTNTATQLTQTGEIIGSPTYMSPEQCLGQSIDQRSDIYSLGCIVYEALAGKQLFTASNSVQYIVHHISTPVVKQLHELRRTGFSPSLISILGKMLEKDPKKRYQSANEVNGEFRRLKEGKRSCESTNQLLRKMIRAAESLFNPFNTNFLLALCVCMVFVVLFLWLSLFRVPPKPLQESPTSQNEVGPNMHQPDDSQRIHLVEEELLSLDEPKVHKPESLPQRTLASAEILSSASSNSFDDWAPYLAFLRRRILHSWFPPKGNEEKIVVVNFKINKNGELSHLRLGSSSGAAIADQAALKAVDNAAPFPKLPDGAGASADVQFTFNAFCEGDRD